MIVTIKMVGFSFELHRIKSFFLRSAYRQQLRERSQPAHLVKEKRKWIFSHSFFCFSVSSMASTHCSTTKTCANLYTSNSRYSYQWSSHCLNLRPWQENYICFSIDFLLKETKKSPFANAHEPIRKFFSSLLYIDVCLFYLSCRYSILCIVHQRFLWLFFFFFRMWIRQSCSDWKNIQLFFFFFQCVSSRSTIVSFDI